MKISDLVNNQRQFYDRGTTRPLSFRLEMLETLRGALLQNEQLFHDALKDDLNKAPMESYMSETGMVLEEIRYHVKKLPRWMKDRRVKTPMAQFMAKSFISPEPRGTTLIIAPWNYPLQLSLLPLVGAISGGNTAILKPSAYAPKTSAAMAKVLGDIFPREYIAVVEGGREENNALLEEAFDYIFFTGSVAVGKMVMEKAARHLTPVTLELGGKSPVIVDETADIALSARRIAFGKVLNAGQTCVAPDYLLIHDTVKESFVAAYREALSAFFPDDHYADLPTIVNERHYRRLLGLLEGQVILAGGKSDADRRFIAPTLLDEVSPDAPVMQEEIFGPLLPMIRYTNLDDAIAFIRERPKPLALYLFTSRREHEQKVLKTCSFGGGCINDTVIHLATPHMPFGGVGASGMGSYHGKQSFEAFTHARSIVKKSTWIDLPMRYHPYTEGKRKIIGRFMR